ANGDGLLDAVFEQIAHLTLACLCLNGGDGRGAGTTPTVTTASSSQGNGFHCLLFRNAHSSSLAGERTDLRFVHGQLIFPVTFHTRFRHRRQPPGGFLYLHNRATDVAWRVEVVDERHRQTGDEREIDILPVLVRRVIDDRPALNQWLRFWRVSV